MEPTGKKDPLEPMRMASEEVKTIIKSVLRLESEKLYLKRPHISADIIAIIKGAVK